VISGWQATISGGTASPPVTAQTVGRFQIDHTGAAAPRTTLEFDATFETLQNHAGTVSGTPSITVDCGAGPVNAPINTGYFGVPAPETSACAPTCTCSPGTVCRSDGTSGDGTSCSDTSNCFEGDACDVGVTFQCLPAG